MSNRVVLYLHIPKCGGTTLSNIIYQQEKSEWNHEQLHIKGGGAFKSGVLYHPAKFVQPLSLESEADLESFLNRSDLNAILGHFNFGFHEKFSRKIKYVTVFRDPVERVISLFSFQKLVQSRHGDFNGIRIPTTHTIFDFVTSPPYQEVQNGQTRRLAGDWNPSANKNGLLMRAKSNLERCFSVVGLTERMDETVVLMGKELGWKESFFSYPKNTNPKGMRRSELTLSQLEAIVERNRLDIELYRFAVDMFDNAISNMGNEFDDMLERYKEEKQDWMRKLEQA